MSLLLKRALDQAAVWHKEQTRKYPGVIVPYMSHVAGVAVTLARHGFDDEVCAAGVLHDSIEDCGITHEEIAQTFSVRVADLVQHASEEDKSLSWEERKKAYLDKFLHKPWEAQAITLADKIDNFQSIVLCNKLYGDPWAMFKRGKEIQVARFDELGAMVRKLPPHPLIKDYEVALDEVRLV